MPLQGYKVYWLILIAAIEKEAAIPSNLILY